MACPQHPSNNERKSEGISINMMTVVRFMVWSPYPSTAAIWRQWSGLRSGHSTQYQGVLGTVTVHQHQYEHSSQDYGLHTVPNTNCMGRQVGTSININIVVRFKVGSQYPIPITREGRWAPLSKWTQWSSLWDDHSTPLSIRWEVRWAPASTWTWWL